MGVSLAARIDAVQEAMLDAPFAPDGWMTALDVLARVTGSNRGQLVGIGEAATDFNYLTDAEPGYEQEFIAIGGYRPDVSWRVAASGQPLQIISERHYEAARLHVRSEAYEDHCRRWDGLYGCQTALLQGDGQLIGLAVMRNERDGKTTGQDRRVFAQAAMHARAAVRIQRAIGQQGTALMLGTLERLGVAALLLDWAGRVHAISPDADELLGRFPDLVTVRAGRLHAQRADVDLSLQDLLGRVRAGRDPHTLVQQLWLSSQGRADLGMLCEVFRLPGRDTALSFAPGVLVVLRHGADIPATRLAPLRQALQLTGAEAEVAIRLANGQRREQIAAERSTSPHTLNSQIKSILSKSDTTREAELVALVARLLKS